MSLGTKKKYLRLSAVRLLQRLPRYLTFVSAALFFGMCDSRVIHMFMYILTGNPLSKTMVGTVHGDVWHVYRVGPTYPRFGNSFGWMTTKLYLGS